MTLLPRRYAALAGASTALAGVAASAAATDLLHVRASPVEAVAQAVIATTPGPVAETLIGLVGTKDKPLLVAGVTVAVVALGALAGVLARRRTVLGSLVFLAMAGLALAAQATRPGFVQAALVPLVVGTAVWLVLLPITVGPATTTTTAEPATQDAGLARRILLLRSGGVALAALVVAAGGRLASRGSRAVEAARRMLRLPVSRGSVPAGAEVGPPGLAPWRSSNERFYRIDTALVVPALDPRDWRLRLHGMVERELTLTYDDLLRCGLTEAWVTLCCVSNPVGGDLIGNAWWSGVRVDDLLREAGVKAGADAVKQTSKDGWTCGTPLDVLTDGRNAMLAVGMNGAPLPLEHGFPVRMVVPGLYGFVSATKWVVDLEVTRFADFSAYWTERGWAEHGPVKTESRVEVPRAGGRVAAGDVRVGGHAWAQHTGIAKVEYRLDGAPWREAELGRVPGNDTWVQWAGTVRAAPGRHTLTVRATDRSGYTQTAARADVVPDGATGWHTVAFSAS
ncbi:MAG: molybdopterin-dependent oxidoreductase [Nocardioidaceae bacterium]